MPETPRLARYDHLLSVISAQPEGCTVKQLWNLVSVKHPDLWSNEQMVRRDLIDLCLVEWVDKQGSFYHISPALGEFYFRRFQVVAERARKPLAEMQAMFNRIGSTLSPNSREDTDVEK